MPLAARAGTIKVGRPPRKPDDTWLQVAGCHSDFAEELMTIAGWALDSLERIHAGEPPTEPQYESEGERIPAWLMRAAVARGKAEYRAEMALGETDPSSAPERIQAELFLLLGTLQHLAEQHARKVDVYRDWSASKKGGRPRTKARNALEAAALGLAAPLRRRPATVGRPRLVAIDDQALLDLAREGAAAGLTVRAALRAAAERHLLESGAMPGSEVRRAAEIRRLTTNLEKRVSALKGRQALPKRGETGD